MTTSGTTAFDLEFTEIAEEAWERAGREMRSGYDLRTARRSMNLLTIEWQNRGINMWTIEQGTINLVQGVNTYALPNDTIDLLEHVVRTGQANPSTQADLSITRISVSTYASLPNKLTQGRPIQVWVQRMSGQENEVASTLQASISATATTISLTDVSMLPTGGFIRLGTEIISYSSITIDPADNSGTLNYCGRGMQNTVAAAHTVGAQVYWTQVPAVTVWPTPDQGTVDNPYYQFIYWRMRRVQDAGSGVQTADMNFRFLPALAAGLAYHIAIKVPELADRIQMLKQVYDEQFDLAAGEDREKAAIRFVPRRGFIGTAA